MEAPVTWTMRSLGHEEKFEGLLQVEYPDWLVYTQTDLQGRVTERVAQYRDVVYNWDGETISYEYQSSAMFFVYQQFLEMDLAILPTKSSAIDRKSLEDRGLEVLRYSLVGTEITEMELFCNLRQLYILLERDGDFLFPSLLEFSHGETALVMEFGYFEVVSTIFKPEKLKTLVDRIEEGLQWFLLEEYQKAHAIFHQVVQIDPYYVHGYFYMAYSAGMLQDYLLAVDSYQQWLMLQPNHPLALNNLAYTYMKQRVNLKDAVMLAERAVKQQRLPAYVDTLGYGYFLMGQYEEALAHLYEALEGIESSMRDEVLWHLVQVYQALGDEESAKRYQDQRVLQGE